MESDRYRDASKFKEPLLRPLTGVGRAIPWPPGVSSLRSSTARLMGVIPAGIKKITPSTVIEKNLVYSRLSVFGDLYFIEKGLGDGRLLAGCRPPTRHLRPTAMDAALHGNSAVHTSRHDNTRPSKVEVQE